MLRFRKRHLAMVISVMIVISLWHVYTAAASALSLEGDSTAGEYILDNAQDTDSLLYNPFDLKRAVDEGPTADIEANSIDHCNVTNYSNFTSPYSESSTIVASTSKAWMSVAFGATFLAEAIVSLIIHRCHRSYSVVFLRSSLDLTSTNACAAILCVLRCLVYFLSPEKTRGADGTGLVIGGLFLGMVTYWSNGSLEQREIWDGRKLKNKWYAFITVFYAIAGVAVSFISFLVFSSSTDDEYIALKVAFGVSSSIVGMVSIVWILHKPKALVGEEAITFFRHNTRTMFALYLAAYFTRVLVISLVVKFKWNCAPAWIYFTQLLVPLFPTIFRSHLLNCISFLKGKCVDETRAVAAAGAQFVLVYFYEILLVLVTPVSFAFLEWHHTEPPQQNQAPYQRQHRQNQGRGTGQELQQFPAGRGGYGSNSQGVANDASSKGQLPRPGLPAPKIRSMLDV